MVRTASWLLLLLFATTAVGQTASDFTARYGYPDAEKFLVRPEITLAAHYGEDRTVCEMLIEPRNSAAMATAIVSEIIDALIPPGQRGIVLNELYESMGAAEAHDVEYQNVTIMRQFGRTQPAIQDETSAIIVLVRKEGVCGSFSQDRPRLELTASDLTARYGEPVARRFKVRPDIRLAVTYGEDKAACEASLGPMRSIIPRDEPTKYVRPEIATEIIDEVLPEADRGTLLSDVVGKSSCKDLQTQDYANVTIQRFRDNCRLPKPEIEGMATIKFKNPSCGNGPQWVGLP